MLTGDDFAWNVVIDMPKKEKKTNDIERSG